MEYYIEYIILQELVIDFSILYITGNLLKKQIILKRLLAASCIGVVYTLASIMIKRQFINFFVVKIGVSILMLTVSYNPVNLIDYLKTVVCFYVVTLFIVGIISASYYLFNSKITTFIILVSTVLAFMAIKFIFLEIRKKSQNREYMRKISITQDGVNVMLNGFIDTGNDLKDNLTGKPVIIANMKSIHKLFPDNIYKELESYYKRGKNQYDFIMKYGDMYKLSLLRYSTISDVDGCMFGFVPDSISVCYEKSRIDVDCVIGLYPRELSKDNTFQALLFKKMLDWENDNECEFYKRPL